MIHKIIGFAMWIIGIAVLFLLLTHPSVVSDTLFGIKIGEAVMNSWKIPTHELFSWSAMGREIIPYEWLIQTVFALVNKIGGFPAIDYLVAMLHCIFIGIGYVLFSRVFGKHPLTSIVLSLLLGIMVSDFFVARPQIIGYILFFSSITLILLFILKKTNLLVLTLPLTYIWANSHASFIFIPYFFTIYAGAGCLYWKKDVSRAKTVWQTLAVYGTLNAIITFFPPLWYKPYELLLQFFVNMKFISIFVTEWLGSGSKPQLQIVYTVCLVVTLIIAIAVSIKTRQFKTWLLALPLCIITLLSYQAVRHIPLGFISCFIVLGLFLPNLQPRSRYLKIIGLILALLIISVLLFIFCQKKLQYTPFDPGISEADRAFLKKNHLQGNMFNEFSWGGHLLYYLYPDYHIFIDPRMDVYLCCELRDFNAVLTNKFASRETFKENMYAFLKKYSFSYLLVFVPSSNPMEYTTGSLMADILLDDPDWKLIYFSDTIMILLKNDGKNKTLIDTYGMSTVTPYRLTPYRTGEALNTQKEYFRMIHVTDSAVTQAGLGQTYLDLNDLSNAAIHFSRAVAINSNYGQGYIGLAKVAKQNGDSQKAIEYLNTAITVSPYLGESYVLLGQLYKDTNNNAQALTVLREGLKQKIDFLTKQKIIQLLSQIQQRHPGD
jgi:tetratricopeptide (TPR) repeat protein